MYSSGQWAVGTEDSLKKLKPPGLERMSKVKKEGFSSPEICVWFTMKNNAPNSTTWMIDTWNAQFDGLDWHVCDIKSPENK